MKPYTCKACDCITLKPNQFGCANDKCPDQWWNRLRSELVDLIITRVKK